MCIFDMRYSEAKTAPHTYILSRHLKSRYKWQENFKSTLTKHSGKRLFPTCAASFRLAQSLSYKSGPIFQKTSVNHGLYLQSLPTCQRPYHSHTTASSAFINNLVRGTCRLPRWLLHTLRHLTGDPFSFSFSSAYVESQSQHYMSSSQSPTCLSSCLHTSTVLSDELEARSSKAKDTSQSRSSCVSAKAIFVSLVAVLILTITISTVSYAISANVADDGNAILSPSPEAIPSSVPNPSPTASGIPPIISPIPPKDISDSIIPFQDVTTSIGITQPQTEQFGGATVADLDGDGIYDLILTYHNDIAMRIYYGTGEGKFDESLFNLKADIHGVAVAPRTAFSRELIMAVSVGGGRGINLRIPRMYLIHPDRTIEEISQELGFGQEPARGRVPVFINLSSRSREARRKNKGGPDILLVNLLGTGVGKGEGLRHFAYQNVKGEFELRDVPGFESVNEERAIVTDIDNDGIMELVHFSHLTIFRVRTPFQFEDVTREVYPGFGQRNISRSISAVVELDFNNDGYWDLYIARARPTLITPRGPPSTPEWGDVLLMNLNGERYTDVSEMAGIPGNSDSMGVSAGDFDNDGFVDIIIATFDGPDLLLMNQGDGTFRTTDPKTNKSSSTRGSNMLAVDYDLDGRVDYITGQAWKKEIQGNFRVMKNMLDMTTERHYLLVRVGNDISRASTALNAVVILRFSRGDRMVRRIGGRGAQAGGLSFLDTVHFGVGSETSVRLVEVRWTTRIKQVKRNVQADQLVSFGRFP